MIRGLIFDFDGLILDTELPDFESWQEMEDSPNGIAAAKAAGLFCVAIPNAMTRDLDVSAADLRLTSLADLPLAELLHIAENRNRRTGDDRTRKETP